MCRNCLTLNKDFFSFYQQLSTNYCNTSDNAGPKKQDKGTLPKKKIQLIYH